MTGVPYQPHHAGYQRPQTWWRRNRVWLILLPIAVLLATVTATIPMRALRAVDDTRIEPHPAVNGQITFNTTTGRSPVVISMELVSHKAAAEDNGYQAPESALVWTVVVRFTKVNPRGASISSCYPQLVDSEGRRYSPEYGLLGRGPSGFRLAHCFNPTDEESWTATWSYGIPDSVRIVALQVGWDGPGVAEFPLSA